MTGWEGEAPGPNPVAQIIVTRTLQVGVPALGLLTAARLVAPRLPVVPLALGGGGLVGVGLSAYFVATFSPRLPLGAPLLSRLPRWAGDSAVALTFDDGPHPETTPRLLDVLARHDARATFFLVGERATRYPALARRIADAGHTVGMHGLRHRTMALQNTRQIESDLREAVHRVEEATGRPQPAQPYLRPPYGFKSWTLGRTVRRLGFRLVAWSVDPRDYDRVTADALVARTTARLHVGAIVLLHERPGVSATPDALPGILSACRERGFVCVALPV